MKELFSSRFGLIAALIGMAVGTGNIWRFPRVMSQNGGGAFLIPWAIFLILWSIPLLSVEFSLGKKMRKGVVGCFNELTQGRYTWIGGFIVLCTLGIMFYYSVVTGWCLYYLVQSITGYVLKQDPTVMWNNFTSGSITPFALHVLVIIICAEVISRGVKGGIEIVSRVLIPSLFVILFGLACYALTLSGAKDGVAFIANFDLSKLKNYKVWLEALTQSAWSTGAGWGLALTYACYARQEDDPLRTPIITGISNNICEILAVLVILPTLFSFFPLTDVIKLTSEGNTGLTFIALPGLFQQIPGGQILAIFFFCALFFAAFSSLMAMFELGISFFNDLGIQRGEAVWILAVIAILIGAPSAFNMNFFDNQDWVWGVGLLVSGFFFAMLVRNVGGKKFATEFVGLKSEKAQRIFQFVIYWLVPLEFLALVGWWFYQAIGWDPQGWWHPLKTFSVGTCLFQWGILLITLFFLNKKLSR